ncbi:MAG: hypothetical protein DI535_04865 [Citrobacter freundii]|nr:MAG: hypothetical protein DI535_04865 [Citrobacter freundii]
MGIKGLFVLLFLQLFTGHRIWATERSQPYEVTIYNTDNGLPQNSVKSIAFDKAGFCWLATEMGLVRFDGRNFKVFGAGPTSNLRWGRVQSIMPTRRGELEVSFIDHTKAEIRRQGSEATWRPVASGTVKGLYSRSGYIVDESLIDHLGSSLQVANIWNRFEMAYERNRIVGLDRNEAYVLLDDHLYYLHDDIVRSYEARDLSKQMLLLENIYLNIGKGNTIKAWLNGAPLPLSAGITGELATERAFIAGDFKALWCPGGSYIYCNARLYRLVLSGKSIYSIRVVEDLPIKDVSSISVDAVNQIYYLGSGINGLYVVRPSDFFVPSLPAASPAMVQNYYTQAVMDSNWLFCHDVLFSRKGDSKVISFDGDHPGVLQPVSPETFYYGRAGELRIYNIHTQRSGKIAILDGRISGMLSDKEENALYVTTRKSIYILSGDTITDHYILPLRDGDISCFVKEDDTHFIVGSTKGLHWYHKGANAFGRTILDSINIRTLYKDADGGIWIGTYGNGFFLYDNGKLQEFPAGPSGSLKTVHAFVDDGRGFFWLTTNNGLFKVSKAELRAYAGGTIGEVYYYLFNKNDGLPTNEFNGGFQLPYAWFPDSLLSLPTLDGLVWFHPHAVKTMFPSKPIYMDKAMLDDGELPAGLQTFNVPPGHHSLLLWVTSPYFGHPQNMQLEYQIEGVMTGWRKITGDGKVLLQNLPSGNYNVVFRKRDGISFTSFDKLSVQVNVQPFFFEQWWFLLIVAVLTILLVYAILQWRTKRLTRKAQELEANVKARTKELKQVIARLEKSEKSLATSVETKDQVISMVLHDLQSPIRFLDMLGRRLARDQRRLDSGELGVRISEINNSTSSLYSFTTQFFAWAKSQHSQFTVTVRWVVLQDIFDNIGLLYTDILKSKHNELIIHPTSLKCYTDPDLLMIVLRNLVDNAHKNTTNGKVELSVRFVENEFFIRVADTGVGMDERQIAAFLHKKVSTVEGLGGMLVATLLEKMNGRLIIQSQPGAGSCFIIRLPLHP